MASSAGFGVFVGDEVTAAGYRLAGAEVRVPEPGRETETLARACADAEWVLIDTTTAGAVAPQVLRTALTRLQPILVLVEDIRATTPLPDPGEAVRRRLGLENE